MKNTEYNEKKRHGTADFPIEYYYVASEHPQYIMPLHWHTEFEIIHVISGGFTLYIDNIKYEMQKTDFAFIGCGMLHRGVPLSNGQGTDNNCTYECIVFDLNMLRSKAAGTLDSYIIPLLSRVCEVKSPYHNNNNIMYTVIDAIFKTISNKSDYYELDVLSLLYRCFSLLYSEGYISASVQSRCNLHHAEIITELLDWIDTHYNEQITLSDLAVVSGYKEKYLCRFFKDYTSLTPIDYINRVRIDNACRELLHYGCSVTEAAFNNGFNDLSYFSKKFKLYMGMTPREYVSK